MLLDPEDAVSIKQSLLAMYSETLIPDIEEYIISGEHTVTVSMVVSIEKNTANMLIVIDSKKDGHKTNVEILSTRGARRCLVLLTELDTQLETALAGDVGCTHSDVYNELESRLVDLNLILTTMTRDK